MNRYQDYKKLSKDLDFPYAYVDMDLLDINIQSILKRSGNKKIRIASKSVRSLEMLKYLRDHLGEKYYGLMCYSAKEALWLAEEGFDNLLVAYPSLDKQSILKISKLNLEGKKIYLMIDSLEHIDFLESLGHGGKLYLCLDIDLSLKIPFLNFGVFRSSLEDLSQVKALLQKLERTKTLELKAVMGYEAQVAGVVDNLKGNFFLNFIIRMLKVISIGKIKVKREKVVEKVLEMGFELDFVNGGGTGSMESTRAEEVVTEIAVGSGFYNPTLFDAYKNFQHEPSAGSAIQIVRQPSDSIYTCFSGGYVGSGALGREKIPSPYLPLGARLDPNEMAGEVQTPIHYEGPESLELGDPIFLRHSKAGELCERFCELKLFRNGEVQRIVKTYRGQGKNFG
jgi:D-serine deaminase-like pyridoxal phosphate-dependent protein